MTQCRQCKRERPSNEFSKKSAICKSCKVKNAHDTYTHRKSKGKCVRCGRLPLENGTLCFDCFMKLVARRRKGNSEELEVDWKNQSKVEGDDYVTRCAYTDEPLTLCENAAWRDGKWVVKRIAKILDAGSVEDMLLVVDKETG